MNSDNSTDSIKQTMSIAEAADYLGILRNSAYEAARRGELPILTIGRRILVSRRGLDRMLNDAAKSHRSS